MSSKLGMLQFQKAPEIEFQLSDHNCADNDNCVCENYEKKNLEKVSFFCKDFSALYVYNDC